MSSLFNKEDEDKLLPPEPCADQYVRVGGGWAGPDVPMSFLSDLFVYLSDQVGRGRASSWLFPFLSSGKRPSRHIWSLGQISGGL